MNRVFLLIIFLAFLLPLASAPHALAAKKQETGAAFRDGAEKDKPYIPPTDKPKRRGSDGEKSDAPVGGLLIIVGAIIAYFFPWLLAKHREHRNSLPIFWLTLLAGWTGVGWLVAFIWSLTADVRQPGKW